MAIELMNEMLNQSLLSEKLLETERGSIVQEIDHRESSPKGASGMKFTSIIMSDPALQRRVLGTQATLAGITQSNIKAFFKEMLAANRMTIIASGGVTLGELITGLNAGLSLGLEEQTQAVHFEAQPAERVAVVPFDVNDQIYFDLGVKTPGFLGDDSVPLSLLGTIMGGGRASVLTRLLRYEKGLVYHVGAGSHQLSSEGMWYVTGACGKDKLRETLEIIAGELGRIHGGGVTQDELEFVKSKRLKSLKMGLQTSASWVQRHAMDEIFSTNETIVDRMRQIDATTIEDLRRVGQKYFLKGECRGVFAGRIALSEATVPF